MAKAKSHPLRLPLLAAASLVITHAHGETRLSPQVVVANRLPTPTQTLLADVTVLEREDIAAAGPEATIGEVLGRIAGIELSRQGTRGAAEDIMIRGANSGHTLVIVDGQRIGSATLGTTALAMIPSSQIERIEVLRGAASALYGSDAIGGVVLITTRREPGSRDAADAGVGSHGAYSLNAAHSRKSDYFNYALQIGETGSRGVTAITNPGSQGFNPDRDGYTRRDAAIHLGLILAPQTSAGLDYLRSEGVNRYDSSWPAASADYKSNHLVNSTSVHLKSPVASNWFSTLRVGQSEDQTIDTPSVNAGQNNDMFRTTQTQLSWQNDISLPLGQALVLLERLHDGVQSSNVFARSGRVNNSLALGWSGELQAHRWQLVTRHDQNTQFGNHESHTLAYGYQITREWRLASNLGTSFKAPTFNDLYFPNTPFVGAGNPALRPETGRSSEVALHWDRAGLRAAVTYFDNHIKNLINWEETPPGSFFYVPSNVASAKIRGWNGEMQIRIGQWDVNANLSAQDPKDQTTGHQLTRRARVFGGLGVSTSIAQTTLGVELHGSGPRYDDLANTRRLGGYTVVNVHSTYAIDNSWSLFARVDNLFDRHYSLARSADSTFAALGTTAFVGIRFKGD